MQIDDPQEMATRLGQEVRAARHRQGMDQRTLAMVAGVAVRTVHRVERGETTVRLDVLMRILLALGLRLDVQGRERT